jgi:hypothetical protein
MKRVIFASSELASQNLVLKTCDRKLNFVQEVKFCIYLKTKFAPKNVHMNNGSSMKIKYKFHTVYKYCKSKVTSPCKTAESFLCMYAIIYFSKPRWQQKLDFCAGLFRHITLEPTCDFSRLRSLDRVLFLILDVSRRCYKERNSLHDYR